MGAISRRQFLHAAIVLAVAAGVPVELAEAVLAADPSGTTLDRTIRRLSASGYSTLTSSAGEPHVPHPANPVPVPTGGGERTLLAFAHFTDVHIVDAQSPGRVEFLDRFAFGETCGPLPLASAFRPQETMTAQVLAAMVRAVNDVQARRIAAGQPPLAFAVSTGDNVDNQQGNELDWFRTGLDGGRLVPNSGGPAYEGVQSPAWADAAYWIPRASIADAYKTEHGFPGEDAWGYDADGLLDAAVAPFDAAPLAMPWYVAYGNHDGLLQGNVPSNATLNAILVGPSKVAGPPPGFDPCRDVSKVLTDPLAILSAGPMKPVTADPARATLTRSQYLAKFGGRNGLERAGPGMAYYAIDDHPGFRLLVLDTVNPGGYAEGSIGQAQFDWLEAQLMTAADRLVMLFSHHGLHSLNNPIQSPDPTSPEPERRVLGDEVEALLHRFPNVIAWICGHTHQNRITRRVDGRTAHMFWDVETAAHIDWPCQVRLVEVLEQGGALVLRLTMVDHAAAVERGSIAAVSDPVLKVAAVSRELSANDPQVDLAVAAGNREERNVLLTLTRPRSGATPSPAVAPRRGVLPATGGDELRLSLAGALAVAAGAGLLRVRTGQATGERQRASEAPARHVHSADPRQ